MPEQDGVTVMLAIEGAQSYWTEVERCLISYFDYEVEKARGQITRVRRRFVDAESKLPIPIFRIFNPVLEFHADPFDVAASLAKVKPNTDRYRDRLKSYLAEKSYG